MSRREVKKELRKIRAEIESAKGCDLIALQEYRAELEMILCRK